MAITLPDNLSAKEISNQGNTTITMNETIDYHRDTRTLPITYIECFRFDSELTEKHFFENSTDYVCGLIAISTKTGVWGVKEFAIPCNSMKGDMALWAAPMQRIKGLTLIEGLNYVREKQAEWGPLRSELIASALMNLNGKLGLTSKINKDQSYYWDRAYLFDHTQAYVIF
ncbi:hypothetical protein [Paenibacillus allorhizoplanae]|nr:hypothetical protein [Paenibacillus allorhizoplanae]